jgi:2,5-diketo-D-gluconate reductase B
MEMGRGAGHRAGIGTVVDCPRPGGGVSTVVRPSHHHDTETRDDMEFLEIQGHRVPKLGFGTFELDGDTCRDAVAHALDVGYRHIDTAQAYGNEHDVGAALEASDVPRDEVFVTTKIWWEDLSRHEVLDGIDRSLERLRTSYVDLALIHWPSPEVEPAEPLRALDRLRADGKIRLAGVSNFTPTLVREALETLFIACNQVEYHPFLSQEELLGMARARGFMLTAYCPLARGEVLTDPTLEAIAERHGKSPAQVTLRWLVQQGPVAAIPRAAKAAHREENIDIFDFELSEEEMRAIHALEREERLIDPDFAPAWRE